MWHQNSTIEFQLQHQAFEIKVKLMLVQTKIHGEAQFKGGEGDTREVDCWVSLALWLSLETTIGISKRSCFGLKQLSTSVTLLRTLDS